MKTEAGHTDAKASMIHDDSLDRERLISIVIPFLNAERFISEAIASVISQTHEGWELLLVDDGSTDRSPAIAHRYVKEFPSKVRYLQHPGNQHRGISASRNLGIAHAKGAYLTFLDSDDVWTQNKLERQLALLLAKPETAMICGSSLYWYSWTGVAKDFTRDRIVQVNPSEEPDRPFDLSMRSIREPWATPSSGCIFVRREAVEAAGNFVDDFDGLFEDQAFYFKLGLKSHVLASNECWYKYRQHPDSVCAVAERKGTQTIAKLKFLRWALQILASSNTVRPDLQDALEQELSRELSHRGPAAMLSSAMKRTKELKQLQPSGYRSMMKRVPGLFSTWHLGRAVQDAWLDSSRRAAPVIERDFGKIDPWKYTSNELEIFRHRREAEMLDNIRGNRRFACVLEAGCAEGVFTEILAERCDSLLATDFSPLALARARQRRQWTGHVSFAQLDLRVDPLPNVFDLIVAIHVVEYIKNPIALRRVREKLVQGVRPGGYLLIGSCTGDNEFREGLWWSRYMLRGGQRINAFFAAHPQLSVVDSAIHPLPGSVSRDILLRKIR